MEPLVTAITFNFSHDASFASSLLEEAGIHCITEQNNTNIPGMNKEISIKVFKRDYETARKIFQDHGLLHGAEHLSEKDDYEERFGYNPKDRITEKLQAIEENHNTHSISDFDSPKTKISKPKIPTWTIFLVIFIAVRIIFFILRHCN